MKIFFQDNNDIQYEALFNKLMKSVFGFTASEWHELKMWDDRYQSYSIMNNGKMVSNISVLKVELYFSGEIITALQLGSVATHSKYRKQGLAKLLMQHILEKYPTLPIFLFSNKYALNFYPFFGFRRIYESYPSIKCNIIPSYNKSKKVNLYDSIVNHYLMNGRLGSKILNTLNTTPIVYSNLILDYSQDIYHLPNIDALLVAKKKKNELLIVYLNAPEDLTFEQLNKELPFSGIQSIRFGFVPDRFNIVPIWEKEKKDSFLFLKGNLPIPNPVISPLLLNT